MAVVLGAEALKGALRMRDAITLLEEAFLHEASGKTVISPRLHTAFDGGWMRILFAVDYSTGYCATKAYHRIEGVGVRYVILLYRLRDGELLALLDGQGITDLRTGAASGVVARKVSVTGLLTVGVIGSGNQARAQLESLAAVHRIESAAVYSPTPANREAFAYEMSGKLGFPVRAVDSAETAVRGRSVVAAASGSNSAEPVLRGAWLDRCRLLCAVGNTRPQFAEADAQCFHAAGLVVVDAPHAFEEAGDLKQAARDGGIPDAKRALVAQIVSGEISVPTEGLVAFKSVGTALQDLALAGRCYELLVAGAALPNVPDLASLRRK